MKLIDFFLITEPPPVIARPYNTSVLPGSDGVMSCFISSTVEYNITWDKPNTLVSLQGHNRVSNSFGTVLQILKVTNNDPLLNIDDGTFRTEIMSNQVLNYKPGKDSFRITK